MPSAYSSHNKKLNNVTLVTLKNLQTGGLQAFRFDVVAKLFKFESNLKIKCWDLPENSEFIYKDGRIIRR